MKTIGINSGFRRGGSLLQWTGNEFVAVKIACENTHIDDGDSSFTTEVPDDFRGAVVTFWGISSMSTTNDAELLGFSAEELATPSPVKGWASAQACCVRATDNWDLDTFGDYLVAMARGADIDTTAAAYARGDRHPSGNGVVLARLDFMAGDQAAASYAVISSALQVVTRVSGCGDSTPEPVLTASGWDFTCQRDRMDADWSAMEEAEAERLRMGGDLPRQEEDVPEWDAAASRQTNLAAIRKAVGA